VAVDREGAHGIPDLGDHLAGLAILLEEGMCPRAAPDVVEDVEGIVAELPPRRQRLVTIVLQRLVEDDQVGSRRRGRHLGIGRTAELVLSKELFTEAIIRPRTRDARTESMPVPSLTTSWVSLERCAAGRKRCRFSPTISGQEYDRGHQAACRQHIHESDLLCIGRGFPTPYPKRGESR